MKTQSQRQRQSLYLATQLAPLCDPYGPHQRWVLILSLNDKEVKVKLMIRGVRMRMNVGVDEDCDGNHDDGCTIHIFRLVAVSLVLISCRRLEQLQVIILSGLIVQFLMLIFHPLKCAFYLFLSSKFFYFDVSGRQR